MTGRSPVAKRPAMRPVRTAIVIAAALVLRVSIAHAAWTVDASGACVETWAPSDLLRGPTAIVNTPLLPLRTLAGGAQYAWNTTEWWPWQIAVLGPAVTLFAGAWGALEGAWWITTGVADTLTGGYFAIAPERATELSVKPEIPLVLTDAAPPPAVDRCGRAVTADK